MSYSQNCQEIRQFLILPVLLVLLIGIYGSEVKGSVPIIMGSFDDCVAGVDSLMDCQENKQVAVPVSYGLEQVFDLITVNTVEGVNIGMLSTENAVRVTVSKTAPVVNYPLRFFHTVSYFPYEEVIKVPDSLGCIDCGAAENPTAGWTYGVISDSDPNIAKIEHSQGFCLSKLLDPFNINSWWRGEGLLGEQATLDNPFSTAHALRMGDPVNALYFHGYEIGKSVTNFEINTNVDDGVESFDFVVSPVDPFYTSNNDALATVDIRAELLGDMVSYESPPDLSNYILYIPAAPDNHAYVQNYQKNMLLVPREEVSKDGGELDKVGVSYYAFRKLMGPGNARVTDVGDGLHNQLFHKHNKDITELAKNTAYDAEYLVHGKKDFQGEMEFEPGMEKVLKYKITNINNSLVSLVTNFDKVKSIESETIAFFFGEVQQFTSMSNEGTLVVDVHNDQSGRRANFIVTVAGASVDLLNAIPAQAISLDPGEMAFLYFDISTKRNLESGHFVYVTVKSPTGKVYDEPLKVEFDTLKHGSKFSWDLQEKNENSQIGTEIDPNDVTAPVITLNGPDDAVVLAVGGTYVDPGAIATDNVDGYVSVVVDDSDIITTKVGVYVVRYDATDSSGNAAKQLTRTVIVSGAGYIDTIPPKITLIGPDTVTVDLGETYHELGAICMDYVDGFMPVTINGTVDTSVVGSYPVFYQSDDDSSGNRPNTAWRIVEVVDNTVADTTAPVIVKFGLDIMTLEVGDSYVEPGAIAVDNVDGLVDVTISGDTVDTSTAGSYTVRYNASDSSGNPATEVIRAVSVTDAGTPAQDTIPPEIMLIGLGVLNLEVGDSYVEPGAIAIDDVDGLVDVTISGDTVDTSTAGSYTVRYNASDSSGNPATEVIRTVSVSDGGTSEQDITPPQLLLSATPTTIWPANGKMVKVNVTMIATDDTDPAPAVSLIDVALSEGNEADDVIIDTDSMIYLRADNGTAEVGRIYTLTYRAVDASGNSTEEDVTITVPHDRSQI